MQLRSTLHHDGLRVGVPATVPIWADVPAGQAVVTGVDLPALQKPGTYEVDLELVQDGESLARCGLRGTRIVLRATDGAASSGPSTEADPDGGHDAAAADPS